MPSKSSLTPGLGLALAAAFLAAGCGGGGTNGGGSNPPPATVSVSIAPPSATVTAGRSQQFTAAVTGSSNTAVTWSVNKVNGGNSVVGMIGATGSYTAPGSLEASYTVMVTATSQADSTKSASASVTLNPDSGTLTSLDRIVMEAVSPTGLPFMLTVNGSNFDSTSQVKFNGTVKVRTFQTSTQLQATILASDVASPGTFSVTVVQGAGQTPVGTLHFFVVPPIQRQSVPVGPGGSASVNIDVASLSPTLSFLAAGLCGLTTCSAGATGIQVSRSGGSARLFLVGNGFLPGTFFSVTSGSSGDVTVTQPLARDFRPTTTGLASGLVTISVANAAPGLRSIVATNPAGEITVFPGGLQIAN